MCVFAACFISWQLTLVFLVLVPLALITLMRLSKMMRRAAKKLLERMSDVYKILRETFDGAKVVKAFNHIYAAELTTHAQPPGSPNRRALVIAGDDAAAKATVTRLLDQFGFDTIDAGPLKEGWRIQRDTPGYGPRRTAEQLRQDLAAAKRYRDQ